MPTRYAALTTSPAAAGTGPLPAAAPFFSPDQVVMGNGESAGANEPDSRRELCELYPENDDRNATVNFVNFTH